MPLVAFAGLVFFFFFLGPNENRKFIDLEENYKDSFNTSASRTQTNRIRIKTMGAKILTKVIVRVRYKSQYVISIIVRKIVSGSNLSLPTKVDVKDQLHSTLVVLFI